MNEKKNKFIQHIFAINLLKYFSLGRRKSGQFFKISHWKNCPVPPGTPVTCQFFSILLLWIRSQKNIKNKIKIKQKTLHWNFILIRENCEAINDLHKFLIKKITSVKIVLKIVMEFYKFL